MLRCVCPQSVCAGPRFTRLLQVTALSSDTCTSLMVRAGALQQWAWAKDLPGPSAKEQRELLPIWHGDKQQGQHFTVPDFLPQTDEH